MTQRSSAIADVEPHVAAIPAAASRPRNPDITLAIISSCLLMVVLDITVVNIALPQVQKALSFSPTGLSWVLNAYTLAFGGLLLLGGRVGDIMGRRRMFIGGIALFTLASLLGGLSTSSGMLLAARALQGMGAAVASPNALALLTTNFAEGHERNRALSIYSSIAGAGGSIGLILGGMLTDWASWRWVLFINVPIGAAIVALTPAFISESERHEGRFDLAGSFTETIGMAGLVYGFIRVAGSGWHDELATVSFVVAAVLLVSFVLIETRVGQPIMPLRLFKDRNRASALFDMLLFPATMYSIFFFLTQFVQDVLGFSPIRAGLAFLPMTTVLLATTRSLPKLVRRFGARRLLMVGTTLLAVAAIWLSRISATGTYSTHVLGPMMVFGLGAGLTSMPLNVTILAGVRREDSGAASGLLQTMQQVGGSLGLAILVTIFGTASRNAAKHPVPGAGAIAEAHRIMADGMSSAFIGAFAFAILALLVAVFAIQERSRPATSEPIVVVD